ncbi:MAG: hypothetical protein FJ243_03440, partial [Nitrospira sp.]|nr:hypothetical protein [Nitrospira sp.]
KTLEEPTKDSLIILISSNPDRLPDTIRSRCSRVNFSPLSYEECEKVIKRFIGQETGAPPTHPSPARRMAGGPSRGESARGGKGGGDRLDLLVRLSMGRPGLALSTDFIGDRERFLKLLQEMLRGNKDGWVSKEEMEQWFNFMELFLREAAIIKITKDEKNLINRDLKNYIMKLSAPMDIRVIIENYQKLTTLREYFKFNLNRSLTWNYTGSLLRRFKNEEF